MENGDFGPLWGTETLEPSELKLFNIDYVRQAIPHAKIGGLPKRRGVGYAWVKLSHRMLF